MARLVDKGVRTGSIQYHFNSGLVVISNHNYDIIMGMDWLLYHRILLHCYTKTVTFQSFGQSAINVAKSKRNPYVEAFLSHIESKKVIIELLYVSVLS